MRSIWLMYHDVYESSPAPGVPRSAAMYHVSRSNFARHLVEIKNSGRRAVTVSEFLAQPSEDTIVITFDDGWRGAFDTALPLLQESSLKATFFITRDFVGRPRFCDRTMIQQAADAGMEIGVHGTTHRMLSSCSQEEVSWEFSACKEFLESLLGREIDSASMPGGSWSRDIVSGAQGAGIKSLCTSQPGINKETTAPFRLKRIAIRQTTSAADIRRYLDFNITKEWGHWAKLQLPRWILGMKYYSLLRRYLMGELGQGKAELFTP